VFLLALSFAAVLHASDVPTGPNADLGGRLLLPPDDEWNRDVSSDPVDPASDAIIARVGEDKPLHEDFGLVWQGAPVGIPYYVVPGDQSPVPVAFQYADESDPGPYPIPPDVWIEGGPDSRGDRHVLVLDRDRWKLYELFSAYPVDGGRSWRAASGAVFDLRHPAPRPGGWTSADAAGLPILPGLARYDEIVSERSAAPMSPRPAISPAARRTRTCRRWGCVSVSRATTISPGLVARPSSFWRP
ncbi:MAG TPA: hypothetical protein PLA50_16170, partial [Bacteroidia bacterium]|nr:hypothetical protein [Bacteroidia bacterium]